MNIRNAARLIVAVIALAAPVVFAKDDDLPYAVSLARAGHTRLAISELRKLTVSKDLREKCLAHYHLARVYEQAGDLAARDRYDDLFAELAAGSGDPEISLALHRVANRRNGNRYETLVATLNRIETELAQPQPDLTAVSRWRQEARDAVEPLLATRRSVLAGYDALPQTDTDQQMARDQSAYELACTLYTAARAYKGDAEEHRLRLLTEAEDLFKPLAFMYNQVIGIHYNLGLVSLELGRKEEAARSFGTAVECPSAGSSREMHQDACRLAVHSLLELRDYVNCARTAGGFLIEYPDGDVLVSARGQSIRIDLADALYGMTADDYQQVKELLAAGPDRTDAARALLLTVMIGNGPLSAQAGVRLAELDSGYAGSIAKGIIKYREGSFSAAVSLLQNGLGTAPADLKPETRMTVLGLAWHYIGQAFHKQDMLLPAVIAFKQGCVTFIPDLSSIGPRPGAAAAAWAEKNRENWRICAQNYSAQTGSALARAILKEALLSRDPRTAAANGPQDDVFLSLAVLEYNSGNFKEAVALLDRISSDAVEYPRALRLKARAVWKQAETEHDAEGQAAAVGLNDQALAAIRTRVDQGDDVNGNNRWRSLYYEARSEGLSMLYETNGFERIIAGIDAYWDDPAADEVALVGDAQYQVYALLNAGLHNEDRAGLDRLFQQYRQADTVIGRIRAVPGMEATTRRLTGSLAQRFLGLAGKYGTGQDPEKEKQALKHYSRCIREYFRGDVRFEDSAHMMTAAAVLIDRAGDFLTAVQLLEDALQLISHAKNGRMDPYADATRTMLVQARDLHFDRAEARGEWDMLVDYMYDGTREDGTVRGRDYFRSRPQETWEERPFNYTAAFSRLREAVMLEIGLDIPERNGIITDMDGNDGQAAEEAWTSLLGRYRIVTGRETRIPDGIYGFLNLCFDELRCREMLAQACLEAGMLARARDLYAHLDAYYLYDPAVKRGYADTCLALALREQDAETRKTAAVKARLGYLEVRDLAADRGPAGAKEYYDAQLKIAECYAVAGDHAAAAAHIGNVLKFGAIPFPPGYEQKLIEAQGGYEK